VADQPTPPVVAAPPTRRGDVVDVLHGVTVSDLYRWLEDGESAEVADWVAAHNQRTRQALDAQPTRALWHERLSAFTAQPTVGSVALRAGRIFVALRPTGADQFVLQVRDLPADDDQPWRTLVDPAIGVADAAAALDWWHPSPDGSLVAYGISEGGSERSTLRLIDVASGIHRGDEIPGLRYADVAWLPDNSGFWYCAYPPDDEYNRHVRFHRVGTDHTADIVTAADFPSPQCWPSVTCSPDGQHLLVHVQVGWGHIDVRLLDVASGDWHTVVRGVESNNTFIFHDAALVGTTTLGAPNGRVVRASLDRPDEWTTLVAEGDGIVTGVRSAGQHLLVVRAVNAIDRLTLHESDGGQVAVLPTSPASAISSLDVDLAATASEPTNTDGVVVSIAVVESRFDVPPRLAMYEWDGRSVGEMATPLAAEPGAAAALVVEHIEYPSLDGTMIGLFIARRADVQPSPDTPLILTGYGGFAIAESPMWMPHLAAWCEAGGVYCIAGLRGGWEHGERWHHAGRRDHKQNVFDDFHAAADWLVAQGYTSRDRLAIAGGSNGGLLMGAAITQRPDLARAVHCAVPLLDMVRFPNFLIAKLWTDEYGDPEIAEQFGWLHAYSPYHRVVDGRTYPAMLLTTAEGDTRVDPLHARKMAALMTHAAADQDERPVLLWQAGRAGHGVGKPASMKVDEQADVLAFFCWQFGWQPGQ
jgi:prolyl oligopeptidase